MSRVANAFKKKALILYLTIGYPDVDTTLKLVPLLESWGADLVELGIPFSDPLADGVTIQEASYVALRGGLRVRGCLQVAHRLREKVSIPLVFMSYYNPIFAFGLEEFCRRSVLAGVDGFIVPDLPPEEGGELEKVSLSYGLDLIYLVAPNSSAERIKLICRRSRGFIYVVSLTGVTGPRERLPEGLEEFVLRVRRYASLPLAVGFGVASGEQARRVIRVANGVVVGSQLIRLIKGDQSYYKLKEFILELRSALA